MHVNPMLVLHSTSCMIVFYRIYLVFAIELNRIAFIKFVWFGLKDIRKLFCIMRNQIHVTPLCLTRFHNTRCLILFYQIDSVFPIINCSVATAEWKKSLHILCRGENNGKNLGNFGLRENDKKFDFLKFGVVRFLKKLSLLNNVIEKYFQSNYLIKFLIKLSA
jgi:hypothetical protein